MNISNDPTRLNLDEAEPRLGSCGNWVELSDGTFTYNVNTEPQQNVCCDICEKLSVQFQALKLHLKRLKPVQNEGGVSSTPDFNRRLAPVNAPKEPMTGSALISDTKFSAAPSSKAPKANKVPKFTKCPIDNQVSQASKVPKATKAPKAAVEQKARGPSKVTQEVRWPSGPLLTLYQLTQGQPKREPLPYPCYGCHAKFKHCSAVLRHLESGQCKGFAKKLRIDKWAFDCPEAKEMTNKKTDFYKYHCPTCNTQFRFVSALIDHVEQQKCGQRVKGCIGEMLRYIKDKTLE
jgi:hypothetical protein